MKIYLVRPTYGSRFQINPPLSLGFLAASLKSHGYADVHLIDGSLSMMTPAEAISATEKMGRPDVIGIQVYTGAHRWTRDFIALARQKMPAVKIVIGGPHVTALKELAMDFIGADYGVLGEGELAIVDFVRFVEGKISDPADVRGLLYRGNGAWLHARDDFGFIKNAAEMPFPDWEFLHPENYFEHLQGATVPLRGTRPVPILSSRGCPYQCTFCASSLISRRTMRYYTPRQLVDQIKLLKERYGADEIFFSDDNLTMDIGRAEEFFDLMINEKVGIHWRAPTGLRIDRLTEPLIKKMALSGGYFVGVGVETGNPEVMKRIKKRLDLSIIRGQVEMLRKHGILVSGFFMCGMHDETREEMEDTLRFALSVPFDRIQMGNYIPYPGSEDFGIIFHTEDPALYAKNVMAFQESETIPPFQALSLEEAIAFQERVMRRFYSQPRVIFSLIKNLRLSQLKAIVQHPWVRQWFARKPKWYADS